MTDDPKANLLTQIAESFARDDGVEATAENILQTALDHVDGTSWASITVRKRQKWHTLASTHDIAARADARQYELGEGPCVDSTVHADWYRSGDVGTDERWPAWGPEAAQMGIGSLLSVRLLDGDTPVGALNMYCSQTGGYGTREDVDFALMYATHVSIALNSARLIENLETAVDARHLVGMAQGILIERFGLDAPRSFEVLRRYSQHTNVRLSKVAATLVTTGKLPSDEKT